MRHVHDKNIEYERFMRVRPKHWTYNDLFYRAGCDPLHTRSWLIKEGYNDITIDRVLYQYAQRLANGETFYQINGHKELPIKIRQDVKNYEQKRLGYNQIKFRRQLSSRINGVIRVIIYTMWLAYTALVIAYGDKIWLLISED